LFYGTGDAERGIGEAGRITKLQAAMAAKSKASGKQRVKTSKKARREAAKAAKEAKCGGPGSFCWVLFRFIVGRGA
jgi:hypothetical protein